MPAMSEPSEDLHPRQPAWPRRLVSRAWVGPLLALLGACGTTQFEAQTVIPAPLITQIPIVVGVATLALGLALVVRINEAYGTIEEDEIVGKDSDG